MNAQAYIAAKLATGSKELTAEAQREMRDAERAAAERAARSFTFLTADDGDGERRCNCP